jgi:hypothetical protein
MGIYTTTYVYFGRMLRTETKERLPESAEPFLTKLSDEHWLLNAPSRLVCLSQTDPVIEPNERRNGFVTWAEARRAIEAKDALERWEATSDEELAELGRLVALAAGQYAIAKTYICEVQWSTLNLPDTVGAIVTTNMRVT